MLTIVSVVKLKGHVAVIEIGGDGGGEVRVGSKFASDVLVDCVHVVFLVLLINKLV